MTTSEHLRAVAYVDGGCMPNPGHGAWAGVVITGEHTRELMGEEEYSTSNTERLKEDGEWKSRRVLTLYVTLDKRRNGVTA